MERQSPAVNAAGLEGASFLAPIISSILTSRSEYEGGLDFRTQQAPVLKSMHNNVRSINSNFPSSNSFFLKRFVLGEVDLDTPNEEC
jgi:hypothetical protein